MLRHIIEAQCRCMPTLVVLVEGCGVWDDVGWQLYVRGDVVESIMKQLV